MKYEQTGIILFTENYKKCVSFYENILCLKVLKRKESLTIFSLSGAYLMIERGGKASPRGKLRSENPTIIRFNVSNINYHTEALKDEGVDSVLEYYDWGKVAKFHDPDGNLCEFYGCL